MKNVQGNKHRLIKCMKCDEEWKVDKRRVYDTGIEPQRIQDFYTNERSEFWDQINEVERLRKAGII